MNTWMYIIAGIIAVNLLCLLNRKQRYNWEDLWYDTVVRGFERVKEENGLKKQARFIVFILVLPLLLITFLVVAPFSTIVNIVKKKCKPEREVEPTGKEDNQLYYWRITGQGTIFCNDCGYKENIVSFIHGMDNSSTGYQCQSCGKFHALDDFEETVMPLICSCGGKLNREIPLFCPQCKSKSMRYDCTIIT